MLRSRQTRLRYKSSRGNRKVKDMAAVLRTSSAHQTPLTLVLPQTRLQAAMHERRLFGAACMQMMQHHEQSVISTGA